MTKIIKMSLVAAVAVAGLTTTSSAKALSDSIKNTDLTGYVRYRYTNTEANEATNQYRIQATIKSTVNDNVTAKIKLRGQGTTSDTGSNANTYAGDADPVAATVQEANFVMKLGGATVIAGKQALATPFADPDDQQGTGLVAVKPLGAVTIAGGIFTNSDAKAITKVNGVKVKTATALATDANGTSSLTGNNIAALAVIGKAAMVNYAVWYANISENGGATAAAGADAINVNLKAKFGAVNVELNSASVDYTGTAGDTLDDQAQTRLVVSSKISKVTVAGALLVIGKDGGDVTLGDEDAKSNFVMEAFDGRILRDTTAYYVMASAPVYAGVTAKLEYGYTADYNGADVSDASETKLSLAYKMSKNFNISAYQTATSGAIDGNDKARVEVKYTF